MSISLAKAIMGGAWAIDPQWVEQNGLLIMNVLKGGHFNVAAEVQGAAAQRIATPKSSVVQYIDPSTRAVIPDRLYAGWGEYKDNPDFEKHKGLVALISISGPITKWNGACGEAGSIEYANVVNAVGSKENVQSVVFLFDTPGGQVAGLHILSEAIKSMPQQTIALVDDGYCYSAGMYLAAHCNEIWATKATDGLGSIGTLQMLADFTGAYEKEGIKVKTIYAPQSTEKNLDWREAMENDNTTLIEAQLQRVCGHFIDVVMENRPKAVKHAEKWNKGATFFADEAIKYGLADRIGSLDDILKKASRNAGARNKTTTTMSTENNNMQAVLKAAGATEFAVIAQGDTAADSGFLLSEDHVNAIAAALENAAAADKAVVAQLQQEIQQAQEGQQNAADALAAIQIKLTEAETTIGQLTGENEELQATVESLNANVTALHEEVTMLKGEGSGDGTPVMPIGGDNNHSTTTGLPKWYKPDGSQEKLQRATAHIPAALAQD